MVGMYFEGGEERFWSGVSFGDFRKHALLALPYI
jgi:hypothetical protein